MIYKLYRIVKTASCSAFLKLNVHLSSPIQEDTLNVHSCMCESGLHTAFSHLCWPGISTVASLDYSKWDSPLPLDKVNYVHFPDYGRKDP